MAPGATLTPGVGHGARAALADLITACARFRPVQSIYACALPSIAATSSSLPQLGSPCIRRYASGRIAPPSVAMGNREPHPAALLTAYCSQYHMLVWRQYHAQPGASPKPAAHEAARDHSLTRPDEHAAQ
jgi:hypothetical protein